MSDYTVQIDWSGKDSLADSDADKIISGADFQTEFDAIETASATKADINGDATEAFSVASLTLGGTAITSTAAELNILDGVTATATELNLLDGITAVNDEDDMSSDSDTSLATQQSIKAYVDAQVAAATMTWTYVSRATIFTSSSGNHNTWTSCSISTGTVPASASAIIISVYSQSTSSDITTAYIRATGIAERIMGKSYSPNNSDDASGDFNTFTIPYKSSVDIKWTTNNSGESDNLVAVYVDGYIS